jgi:hypothetical protein
LVSSGVFLGQSLGMTLNERELRALAELRHFLERDDPALARRLRTMRYGPTPTGLAVFVLVAILVGFLFVGIGRGLDVTAVTAFGVLFAACVPIAGGIWFRPA